MQVLTAEIGPERGGLEESTTGKGESDEASAASEAAATIAQGQATEAKSMGEAVKDFLTTPQVLTCQPTLPLSPLFPAPPLPFHPPLPSPRHLFVTCTHQCTSHSANTPPPPPLVACSVCRETPSNVCDVNHERYAAGQDHAIQLS